MHIVVSHRSDPQQPYANRWRNDNILEAITTPNEVANLLRIEKQNGNRVYVHRCALGPEVTHLICCSVEVDQITRIDRKESYVTFKNAIPLDESPPLTPMPGQNYY